MAKNSQNPNLERNIIKAITTNPEEGQKLLSLITADHFSDAVAKEAYGRIKAVLVNRSTLLEWDSLCYDQVLSDKTRNALLTIERSFLLTDDKIKSAFGSLEKYRKHRALISLHNELGAELSKNTFDVDVVEQDLQEKVNRIHSQTGGIKILTLGVNDNAAEVVQKIIDGEAVNFIPTGFNTFDAKNVGFPEGSFVLLAATTGGGKSALAKKLGTNIASVGHKVGLVPLEMNNESVLQRILSEHSQITMTKFLDTKNRFVNDDATVVWNNGYVDLSERIAIRGGQFNLLEFEENVDVHSLLLRCKSLGIKVVIIDYLGLLEGAAADDQVKALDRIARYCKVWADKNKAIVIAAAQLSEDGMVRYAKAMKEHASTLWQWVYNANCIETKSILINQTKSRQQEAFDFYLHFDPATMLMRDMSEEEMNDLRGAESSPGEVEGVVKKGGKGAKKRQVRHFDDLDEM